MRWRWNGPGSSRSHVGARRVREVQYDPCQRLDGGGWPEWVVVAKVQASVHRHGGGRSQPQPSSITAALPPLPDYSNLGLCSASNENHLGIVGSQKVTSRNK